MNKRGQLTVFVIISIALVSVLLVYFSVKEGLIGFGVDPEIKPIYSFVDNCVQQTAEDAIYHIGQYGGYYIVPGSSTEEKLPYYFDKGRNLLPSKERVQAELSEYLINELFFCTRNFVDFPDFDITQGKIEVNSRIVKGEVIFGVKYPLSINKGESSYTLSLFHSEIPSRLDNVYHVAFELIEQQMIDGNDICINCLSDISLENKIYISINDHPFDEEVIVYTLIDEDKKINGEDYRYYFANRFDYQ